MKVSTLEKTDTPEAEAPVLRAVPDPDPLPPILLAVVLRREGEGEGWRVRVGRRERVAIADPSVDPLLIDRAVMTGGRVVLEAGDPAVIVGALATHRALEIDASGDVDAHVRNLSLTAHKAVVKTGAAFLRLDGDRAEIFARETVMRAKELTRLLGRMIKLN